MGYWEIVRVADGAVTAGLAYDDATLLLTGVQYVNTTAYPCRVTVGPQSVTIPAGRAATIPIPATLNLRLVVGTRPKSTSGPVLTLPLTTRWP